MKIISEKQYINAKIFNRLTQKYNNTPLWCIMKWNLTIFKWRLKEINQALDAKILTSFSFRRFKFYRIYKIHFKKRVLYEFNDIDYNPYYTPLDNWP